ncbi:hypothetical protein B0J11DRAFT_617002 [Dendryphion nanum]|uniref:Uncharacterized protein n=1 Tax=Dendryphion nanum TaxID=256645 RepID=A0A9P9DK04_9PLEO|nr:hypothetical protein B0J11DRAFT_617002 [Dendryphion nanum]
MDIDREKRPLTAAVADNVSVEGQIIDNTGGHSASRANSPSPSSPTASNKKKVHFPEWGFECLCLLLAIAALAAMVIFIATAQNQPMTAWRRRHYNISINAVVAIFSALLKGTCMYIVAEVIGQTKWHWFEQAHRLSDFKRIDNASRGPWGSTQLFCRMRVPALARLGAFVTIIAMAVDPFTQNIIATSNCQTPSKNQTVLVPTADSYTSQISSMARNEKPSPGDFTLWGIDRHVLGGALKASVYGGLFGTSTTVINASIARPSCPGINCTFPRYSTLGVCHRCADITASISKACDPQPSTQDNVFRPPCKWSLPNGQLLRNYASSDDYYNSTNGKIDNLYMNFAIINSTLSTITLPHVPGTFTNVSILANVTSNPNCTTDAGVLFFECGNQIGVPTMELRTIAIECSLFPCTRTYTASVVNGAVVETEVKRSFGNGSWMSDHGEWRGAMLPNDIIINPGDDCKAKWSLNKGGDKPPCTFTANSRFTMALGNFFWGFWNGTVTGKYYGTAWSNNDALEILHGKGVTNLTYIDHIFAGITDSMTAAIRLTGTRFDGSVGYGGGQGDVTGKVLLADTCIDVRWGWIALPSAVALFTLVLLVSTVVFDRVARKQPAWKTSALPLVFHGFDIAEFASKGPLLTTKEMEKEAEGLWVRLSDQTSGSIRLKTCRAQGVDGKDS